MSDGAVLLLTKKVKADGTRETDAEVMGRVAAEPAVASALMAHRYQEHVPGYYECGDINSNISEVKRIAAAVKAGDLSDLEGMLVGQAVALQTMAASLANRAQLQQGQRNLEAFLGLALKAQAQSRATISALVDLKFPRQVAYVKQTNVANGPQQVNNGVPLTGSFDSTGPARAHGEAPISAQSKLLEEANGEWLDTRAQGPAGRTDQVLEAVGKSDRPKVTPRKVKGLA